MPRRDMIRFMRSRSRGGSLSWLGGKKCAQPLVEIIETGGGGTPALEVAKTANYTVLAADSGTIFTNEGATAEVDFLLPPGATGLNYTYYTAVAQIMKVIAQGADMIVSADLVSVAGGRAQNATPGYCLTLRWLAGKWVATSGTGSWDVNVA